MKQKFYTAFRKTLPFGIKGTKIMVKNLKLFQKMPIILQFIEIIFEFFFTKSILYLYDAQII